MHEHRARIEPALFFPWPFAISTLFALWRQPSYLQIGSPQNLLSIKGLRLEQTDEANALHELDPSRTGPFNSCIFCSGCVYECRTCFRTLLWRQIVGDDTYVLSAHTLTHTIDLVPQRRLRRISHRTRQRNTSIRSQSKNNDPQHKSKKKRRTIETNWPFRICVWFFRSQTEKKKKSQDNALKCAFIKSNKTNVSILIKKTRYLVCAMQSVPVFVFAISNRRGAPSNTYSRTII